MRKLVTPRQLAVLRFIAEHAAEHGYPPSLKEMGAHFGWTSTHAPYCHLNALKRLGLLKVTPNIARGLKVTAAGHALLALNPGAS